MSYGRELNVLQVIEMFQLKISEDKLMSRCTKCNGEFIKKPLTTEEAVEAAKGFQVIPSCLFNKNLEFWQCMTCYQLYWEVVILNIHLFHFFFAEIFLYYGHYLIHHFYACNYQLIYFFDIAIFFFTLSPYLQERGLLPYLIVFRIVKLKI